MNKLFADAINTYSNKLMKDLSKCYGQVGNKLQKMKKPRRADKYSNFPWQGARIHYLILGNF